MKHFMRRSRTSHATRLPEQSARPSWLAGMFALALLCALLFAAAPDTGAAQSVDPGAATERAVKAAFIYKFQAYVEWPEAVSGLSSATAPALSPFVIGVIGADAIASDLTRIASGRTAGNRPIQVRTMKETDSLDGVQLLYIGSTDTGLLRKVLKEAQRHSILTITDAEGALNLGSIINFRIIDDRVRFEVSFDTAEKSGLKLSSRLIPVAYHVQKVSP